MDKGAKVVSLRAEVKITEKLLYSKTEKKDNR